MSTSIYTEEFGPNREDAKRLKRAMYRRTYKLKHPDRIIASNKRQYDSNKEYWASYQQRNATQCVINTRRWQQRNPTKYRQSQKLFVENNPTYQQNWSVNNRHKRSNYSRSYSLLSQRAIPPWADQTAMHLIYKKRDELNALWGTNLEVDHIVPLQGKTVCGLHCEDNLQLLDKPLNASKNNLTWPDMP